jgi:CRP-like cAMP-binding protein
MIMIMSELFLCLRDLATARRPLAIGEPLFRAGDPVERLYLVLTGEIVLERMSVTGSRLILQRAKAGDIVAEASCFAQSYHCDARSEAKSEVASIPRSRLEIVFRSNSGLVAMFAQHLARGLQQTRIRAEILSLHRLSDKLDAWLHIYDSVLPDKGRWLILAHELGVTPEALYRELGKRRKKSHVVRSESAFRA